MDHDKYLQIMRKIDQHVKKKMLKINTIFQQFDSSGDGQLSKKEFTQGVVVLLKNAPFDVTKADIHGVFDTIDNDTPMKCPLKNSSKNCAIPTRFGKRVWTKNYTWKNSKAIRFKNNKLWSGPAKSKNWRNGND